MVSLYRVFLFLKFAGVLAYAGGFAGAFLAGEMPARKRAVHAIASPGLVLTWMAGCLVANESGIGLRELWILGGLVLSFLSLLGLVYSVSRDRRTGAVFSAAAIPLLTVLALMVLRPTWSMLGAR
ncbi:hypothetical protein LZC95_51500 [Pendulispora brunnea]|uniref:Uncharacterized protein n=1 Tax=Pendulispora brunnea TaxID=2905690 RepID=A0ABZ2KBR6_9BACT